MQSYNNNQRPDTMLESITCPLSLQIFFYPVTVFPSGIVYEQDEIDLIISTAKKKNIMPRCPITEKQIIGYSAAYLVQEFVSKYFIDHPEAKNQQYQPIKITIANNNANQQKEPFHLKDKQGSGRINVFFAKVRAERMAQQSEPKHEFYNDILHGDYQACAVLINDIQDLIYALHFEIDPRLEGNRDNDSLLHANNGQPFFSLLPWQKITVNEGPKEDCMYVILKAAIRAIKEIDSSIVNVVKERYPGQYDCVKTLLGGVNSMSLHGYASFANTFGTVTNQPGYLVDSILKRVGELLNVLSEKYKVVENQEMKKYSR